MAGYQFFIRFGHLFRFCPVISNHFWNLASFKHSSWIWILMYFWIHSRNCRKNSNLFFQEHVLRVFVLFKRSVNSMMSRRNIKGFFVWHGKVFYVWCLVSLFEKGYYKVSPFLWFITHGYGRRTTKTYLSTLGEIHERGKKRHIVRCACFVAYTHICIQYLEVS